MRGAEVVEVLAAQKRFGRAIRIYLASVDKPRMRKTLKRLVASFEAQQLEWDRLTARVRGA